MDPQPTPLCTEWQPLASGAGQQRTAAAAAGLRLQRVNRLDIVPVPARLEDLLPPGHLARWVWRWVDEVLDLSAFYAPLVVHEEGPGRAAIDPRILVALWLFATMQGIVAAREVARLCVEHLAYIWLCGGVAVSYHSLSTFWVAHGQALDDLLTWIVRRMIEAGLLDFEVQAQDGMRVRASAGAASFHRRPTLEQHRAQAEAHLADVETGRDLRPSEPPGEIPGAARTARQQAAQLRAAQERVTRVQQALAELPAAEAAKERHRKPREDARVSSTDPCARAMKMPDGGYRPAYNWQFASDSLHDVIVGVALTNAGSDQQQLAPMLAQILQRYGGLPHYWAVDGGFLQLDALEAWAGRVTVLAPVPPPKGAARQDDRYAPRPSDSPAIAAWRARMGSDLGQALYQLRAQVAELVNAQVRTQHGVQQVGVRGLSRVRCLALWGALAHNLLIWIKHCFAPAAASASAEGGA